MRSRITATITALVLATSFTATPVAAQSVDESLVVLPTFSVVVGTSSVNYGSVAPGATSGWRFIEGTISSNAPVAMDFEALNFTGPVALDDDIRYMCVSGFTGSLFIRTSSACGPASVVEAVTPTYSSTVPITNEQWELESIVTIPSGALAGSYASQIELTFYNHS